ANCSRARGAHTRAEQVQLGDRRRRIEGRTPGPNGPFWQILSAPATTPGVLAGRPPREGDANEADDATGERERVRDLPEGEEPHGGRERRSRVTGDPELSRRHPPERVRPGGERERRRHD